MPSGQSSADRAARRAPRPEDRRRDAERTRAQLIEAAYEEFSSRGFTGARVLDIAARANVDKQLITYYFEGKEGLYQEVLRTQLQRDAAVTHVDESLADNVARYVSYVLSDPRSTRLTLWAGLSDAPGNPATVPGAFNLDGMQVRQDSGEIPADLDPAAVLMVIIGAVSAAVAMPQVIRALFGIDPASPEFEERYASQLRDIVARMLRDNPAGADKGH